MADKTSLYLLSGFLGSGKTTLVKRLLQEKSDAKIGVIMNEFGKISIDGPIIQRDNMELIEVTRGSIFCSCLKMAFADALIEMSNKNLDYLIVESSGLADPSNIGEILSGIQGNISNSYDYCGNMTVVDASQFLKEFESVETIKKQIECSDLTWINKKDLVDDETLELILNEIKNINPDTDIRLSSYFHGALEVLGNDLSRGKFPELRTSINTPENKPKTMSISFREKVEKISVHNFIKEVMNSAFRVKGFVNLENQWWEVHGVGDCIDFYETDRQLDESILVIISKVGPQIIREVDSAWQIHVGIPKKLSNG